MEWVETTGKSLDQAKELALDQLGVAADDAEFEVLEEPRTGLFGRVRGEAASEPGSARRPFDRSRIAAVGGAADAGAGERSAWWSRDGQDESDGDDDRRALRHRRRTSRGRGRSRRRSATIRRRASRRFRPRPTGSTQGESMSNDQRRRSRLRGPDAADAVVEVAEVRQPPRVRRRAWSTRSVSPGRRGDGGRQRDRGRDRRPGRRSRAARSARAGARCWRSRISPGSRPSAASAITTLGCGSTSPATARSAGSRSSGSPATSPTW